MPSPVGHSLAGYALARLTRVRITRDERVLFVFAACVAILPDLFGEIAWKVARLPPHSFSHSIAAMLLLALIGAAIGTRRGFRFWPVFLVIAAAYGSHLLADLLRPDFVPLEGEQLFWPLRSTYAIDLNILPHIPAHAAYAHPAGYARALAGIVLRELLVLGPLALLAHFVPPRIPARAAPPARSDLRIPGERDGGLA